MAMIKKGFVLVGTCVLLALPSSLLFSAEALQSTAMRYAALQAARGAFPDMEKKDLSGIVRDMEARIVKDTRSHREVEASKRLIKELLGRRLDQRLDRNLVTVHKNLSNPAAFSLSAFKSEVRRRFGPEISRGRDGFVAARFDEIYSAARAGALKKEIRTLNLSAYPSQEEVDKADGAGWSSGAISGLERKIQRRMKGQAKVLLEENEAKATLVAGETIADIRRQFKAQMDAVDKAVGMNVVTEARIAAVVKRNVYHSIGAMRRSAEHGHTVYGPFPSVTDKVGSRATALERDRFKAFINAYQPLLSKAEIKRIVQSDTAGHREEDASTKIITGRFLPRARKAVIDQYSKKIGSQKERRAFQGRLKGLLGKDEELGGVLRSRVRGGVRASARSVRSEIAEIQLKAHFAPVAGGGWAGSEYVLKRVAHSDLRINGFEQAAALQGVSLGGKPHRRSSLLEETEHKLVARVNKLLAEGRRAWDGQLAIVKGMEGDMRSELSKKAAERSEKEWLGFYTGRVRKVWAKDRVRVVWHGRPHLPPNAATKYAPLFAYTGEEIEKIIHMFFEARRIRLAEKANVKHEQRRTTGPRRNSVPDTGDAGGGVGKDGRASGGGGSGGSGKLGQRTLTPDKRLPWWVRWLMVLVVLVLMLLLVANNTGWLRKHPALEAIVSNVLILLPLAVSILLCVIVWRS
ncbi:hypothetical protein ACFL2T_01050 [Elusimicrobiota bacterium]